MSVRQAVVLGSLMGNSAGLRERFFASFKEALEDPRMGPVNAINARKKITMVRNT
jgi:hypothetical protein